jgi:hypothetical protein
MEFARFDNSKIWSVQFYFGKRLTNFEFVRLIKMTI